MRAFSDYYEDELITEAAKTAQQWYDEKFGWGKELFKDDVAKNRLAGVQNLVNILKKNHRIEWYLTWFSYRVFKATVKQIDNSLRDGTDFEKLEKKLNRVEKRLQEKSGGDIDLAFAHRRSFNIITFQHYLDLDIPEINQLSFLDPFRTPAEMLDKLAEMEMKYSNKRDGLIEPEGEELLRFKSDHDNYSEFDADHEPPFTPEDTWVWYDTQNTSCSVAEKEIMGHCGADDNATTMYRLARVVEVNGTEQHEPHATMAMNEDTIRQTKQRNNNKPVDYTDHIFQLLMTGQISGLDHSGAYESENNFKLEDLTRDQYKKLGAKNIHLDETEDEDESREAEYFDDFITEFEEKVIEQVEVWDDLISVGYDKDTDNLSVELHLPEIEDVEGFQKYVKSRHERANYVSDRGSYIEFSDQLGMGGYFYYLDEYTVTQDISGARDAADRIVNYIATKMFGLHTAVFGDDKDEVWDYNHEVYKKLEELGFIKDTWGGLDYDDIEYLFDDGESIGDEKLIKVSREHNDMMNIDYYLDKPESKLSKQATEAVVKKLESSAMINTRYGQSARDLQSELNRIARRRMGNFWQTVMSEMGEGWVMPSEDMVKILNDNIGVTFNVNVKINYDRRPYNQDTIKGIGSSPISRSRTHVSGVEIKAGLDPWLVNIEESTPDEILVGGDIHNESGYLLSDEMDALVSKIIRDTLVEAYRAEDTNQEKFDFVKESRRMKRFSHYFDLVREGVYHQDANEDHMERSGYIAREALGQFLDDPDSKWELRRIPAARLSKIWLDYGRSGVIRDEKGLDRIAQILLDGIAALRVFTQMAGHTDDGFGYHELFDEHFEMDKEEVDAVVDPEKLYEFITVDVDGVEQDFMSDYGLRPLEELYSKIYNNDDNPEKLLQAIDRALNIMHQRSDLSAFFIEGGSKTLNKIFSQGGYTSEET